MQTTEQQLTLRFAEDNQDRLAAARLRYEVFVEEMGGDGPLVDHEARFERDRFDPYYDHLILVDETRDADKLDHVIGVYRLLNEDKAKVCGQFYSEDEYDLTPLRNTGRKLLELGRSCLRQTYRNGPALHLLWDGLARYVAEREIEILFGVASFRGTDVAMIAHSLSHLYYRHLAPPELQARAHANAYQKMDLLPEANVDRVAAMREVPALMKSYLRLGGYVGDGAFVDYEFNTTDVCLVMDTAQLSVAGRSRYAKAQNG